MTPTPRYRFGPRERRGLVAGWRGGQIASVAGGLLLGVLALRSRADVPGVVVALACVLASAAFACWPVAGRTGEEWLPTVTRWTLDGVAPGGRRRRSPQPGLGRPGLGTVGRWTRSLAGLELLAVAPGANGPGLLIDRPVGVVWDRRARTYTAALGVRGHCFALLGPEDKERRVAEWSAVLGALAREGSLVHRLQWVAATIPDDGRANARYVDEEAVRRPGDRAADSYAALLELAGGAACRHEVLVTVQVRAAGAAARAMRTAGGGAAGATAVLLREVLAMRRLLADADVTVDGILTPRQLARALRRASDPRPAADPGPGEDEAGGTDPWPWPMALEARWRRLRTDATWHATYWVTEWPRVDVGPDFLGPLLLGATRRTVALVMEPISPTRATRQVEQARTADLADSELRRRGGFLATARRAREADVVARREEELAEGHGSFRFSGYVTVSAVSVEELEAACEATEHAAGQARLEIRRLFGDQESAFTCTLPLARGLA
jgi:Putative type VII ESX secretion system translocon, EccE